MPFLIILRGPAGSGKSALRDSIRVRLGIANTAFLNLDEITPQDFDCNLDESLKSEQVIGEMYSGNSHTTDPHWIQRFKANNYTILSVILRCSLECCIQRVRTRTVHPISPEIMTSLYNQFYQELQNIFSFKADVEEICVDTEHKSIDESSNIILRHLKLNTSSK
jgi:tRNA uridine 5-carbamoylmethylation protein Kti12